MPITFTLLDPDGVVKAAVNDQTAGLQTGDGPPDDNFIDTDVAYSTLPLTLRNFLELDLGLIDHSFPDTIGVATRADSVTVTATGGTQITGTTFTDAGGNALDGDDSGLNTVDGKDILLFAGANDSVIGRYDSDGVGGVDSIAFVIFKEDVFNPTHTEDQVTFRVVTYVPIFHGDPNNPDDAVDLGNNLRLTANESISFSFAGAPSGSNLFMMFGNPNSTQIVVIGKDPLNQSQGGNINTKDVLNISQANSTTSFGVNGNQINPNEGAFITYVTGATPTFLVPNLSQNEADIEANIAFTGVVNATTASFTVNQTNPPTGPVTVKITALTTAAEPGVNFVDGLTNDSPVTITSASVVNNDGGQTPVVSISGGVLTVSGLSSGDVVTWTTSGTHDRVLIENISNADGIGGNDNNTFDIGGFAITSASSSSTAVGQQIVIEDDGPTASQAQQTGTVDEDGVPGGIAGGVGDVTGEATVATGSVAPLFNSGTDTPLTFSLKTDTSGLPALTSGGVAVTYVVVGNTLTASAGGNTVFTFSLNGTTGAWTFTLADQLDHPTLNGLPGDDTENDLSINLSSILKATDADGDSANAAANALIVTVDDDTPTASQAQQTGTVDEDGVPGGIAGGVGDVAGEATVATGSVAPLFNPGADAPLTFSLKTDTSGLPALTSGGVAVTYAVVGNTLTASAGGNTVFTFVLNGTTGAWTFTLADQLDHPTLNGLPGDDTENDLSINLSSILQATDFDGDSVTAAANALIVTVDDDTPTASEAQQAGTVDEDGVPGGIAGGVGDVAGEATVATGNVGALFNPGADAPLTFSLKADTSGLPALTSGGVAVTYVVVGNTLTASAGGNTVFTFSLNGTTGAWTFTLADQLDHPTLNGLPGDDTENDLSINLSSILQATDFDGDSVTAAANALIVTVDDDTPTASEAQQTGTVDEDGVPGGIAGGVGDVAGEATVATGSVAPLFNPGADAPLTFSLKTDTSGLQALTSGGVAVTYAVVGNTLTASAGGNTVFTFVLNGTTGDWTFTLADQLDHPTLNGLPGDDTENDLSINLSSILQATDFDGDSVTAAANALIVTVDDDTPTASQAQQTGTVDEDGVPGGIAGGVGDVAGEATVATGSVAPLFSPGADAPLTFSLKTDTSGLQALTSGGVAVTYAVVGNTLTASAGGNTVFTFVLNGTTGDWTFTLADQLDHPTLNGLPGDNTENDLAVNLSSILQATDFDGDSVTAAANALIVTVDDDTPTASLAQQAGTVDEDGVPGGIAGGLGDVAGEATVATGSVAPLFNPGADAPLTFSLKADTSGLQALTSGGVTVTYVVLGNTLTASAGGNPVFTFALNGTTGDWTFTLVDQLDHPTLNGLPGDNTENDLLINLSSILQATDFDGDTVNAAAQALIVTVDDDTPTIDPDIVDGLVDFTTISGPNPLDFGGSSISSVTHSLNGSAGADSPATFSVTASPATVTIFDGTSAQVTLLRDITANGTVVTYFKDVDSSGTHNAGDTDFFKLSLSGGNYTFEVLQNPVPAEVEFAFTGAPPGNNLFMMFGDLGSAQIVVIGEDPLNQSQGGNIITKDVVQISNAQSTTSFGVNGNQINPDEGAFITYVTGATPTFLVPNLSQNEADIEANIAFQGVFDATAASFTVNQTNPPTGPVTVKISAFSTAAEPGVNFVDGLTNDTHVDILTATVVEANPNDAIHAVATVGADGVLTVTGLATGDQVKWVTSGNHERVLIQNISNADGITGNDNNTFDIGGFSLIQAQPSPDEKLDFTVQISDADGDTDTDSFSIGIDGTGVNDNDHVDGVIA